MRAHAARRTLVIGTDLPLQGAAAVTAADMNKMVELYLDQIHHTVGKFHLVLKVYDDSTAAKGQWDDQTCRTNARAHVGRAREIAVLGTFNSGCAMLELPVLNKADPGPMLMVSPSNTNPGLTKHWGPGTPRAFYPTGQRSYARVLATDDYEGTAAANFAHGSLHAQRVLVLNDGAVYGKGIARSFVRRAKRLGISIVGNATWNPNAFHYKQLFRSVKPKHPDAVYLAGLYDNNGRQLIKDKVSVLGRNRTVKLLAPDAFTGYPDLADLPAGQGLYMTYSGLPLNTRLRNNPTGRKLIAAFNRKYGHVPRSGYVLDAAAALQVILAAIRESNGTRAGVTHAVFRGAGITIPATTSVLGRPFKINPMTGDVSLKQISIERIVHKQEKFVRAQTICVR